MVDTASFPDGRVWATCRKCGAAYHTGIAASPCRNCAGDLNAAIWYVNFRIKGAESPIGGYLRCDTQRELQEFVVQLEDETIGVFVQSILKDRNHGR